MSVQTLSVTRTSRAARVAAVIGLLVLIVLALAPWWAGRADMRLMGEIFLYLALASLWNLMAGYAGLVSVGQQAYVGFGGYMLFRPDHFWWPASGRCNCGSRRSWRGDIYPRRIADIPAEGGVFCDRHLGYGRGVPFVFRPNISPRRRLWFLVTGQHRQVHRRQPINA